jgi:heme-degrading monooxygenase HmoA
MTTQTGIVFINVFIVQPDKQQDALQAIERVYREAVSQQPGFIGAKLLKSNDRKRVTAIADWENEDFLKAMRITAKFKELHDRAFYQATESNDGHVYDTIIDINKQQ